MQASSSMWRVSDYACQVSIERLLQQPHLQVDVIRVALGARVVDHDGLRCVCGYGPAAPLREEQKEGWRRLASMTEQRTCGNARI
jgi:hypothetical protein